MNMVKSNKEEIIDKLNRALEMEEIMVGMLIDLCHPDALPKELHAGLGDRLKSILAKMKDDTLRHKKIVMETMEGLK